MNNLEQSINIVMIKQKLNETYGTLRVIPYGSVSNGLTDIRSSDLDVTVITKDKTPKSIDSYRLCMAIQQGLKQYYG